MTWANREPADQFFRRFQDLAAFRAENHPDPDERADAKAEVERLNSLIGAFGRTEPK